MPNALARNLHLCFFSKIRRPLSPQLTHPPEDHNRPPPITTALIKNFNSLYDITADPSTQHSTTTTTHYHDFTSSESEPNIITGDGDGAGPGVDFAAVFASQRFFFSTPGTSNSIIESSSSSRENDVILAGNGVAIQTYSPDPFMDFRKSMQEMVEARDLIDVRANWDYLHDLLLCYLSLNPKSTHKFIVGAFADLIVTLMSSPSGKSRHRRSGFSGDKSRY
ncbi:Ovate protein family, C-terminal [Dillenia turbinata]|uniref:Transcription repressor n=1 Tax=Dillenia turbinata TaxID=194707 RepID=A0AAN8VNZ3_9MAGN